MLIRKFYILIFSIVLISCLLLSILFEFESKVTFFHLITIGFISYGFYLFETLLFSPILKIKLKTKLIVLNTMQFIFGFSLLFFYLFIIGSQYFWGDTITFNILKKYLLNPAAVISIIPFERWITFSILAIILLLFTIIPLSVRARNKSISSKRKMLFALSSFIILLLCFKPAMWLKRTMHFNQEPILYFSLGPIWQTGSDEGLTLNKVLSSKDIECIEYVKPKTNKDKLAIIILLDALRSDHTPMYGYHRNTTPFLDSLYRSNKLLKIKNAFSGSTNTLGGVSSLFYSKDWNSFGYKQLSLMQYFKLSGYKTYAYLTGYHSGWYGLSNMYKSACDYFYESTENFDVATDDDLVTLNKINKSKWKTGSFIYIHLLSTHNIGIIKNQFKVFKPYEIGIGSDIKETSINKTDNGIYEADFVVKNIFQKLQNENLLDKSTIYIVSDHGNLLGEDGIYGHSGGLHQKLLEIPMLIYDTDLAWYQENNIASLLDIAPSLSKRLFNEIPKCWNGQSLHTKKNDNYSFIVTASNAKSELKNGIISYDSINNQIKLSVEPNNKNLSSILIKKDSVTWVQEQ